MKPLHSLLKRQIKKYFNDPDEIPLAIQNFIQSVNEAYLQFDEDRNMLERSLDLSSQELLQANSELRSIFQTFPDLLYRLDSEGKILDCKAGSSDDLYLPLEKLIGKKIQEVPFDIVGSKLFEAMHQVQVSRSMVSIEYSLEIKGEQNYYEARLMPMMEDQIIVVVRNITDLRQAQEELILLATAIEQASESVIISDREGKIRYANPAFEKLSGFTREEIAGRDFTIFKNDKHDEKFYRRMWDNISNGRVWSGRISNRMKDGTIHEFETRISPVRDSSGEIVNFVSVNRDMTHEIALEAKLQRAQKMEVLGLLAGGVAHDLNNVLSGIVSYPDLLLMELPPDSPLMDPIMTIKRSGEKAAEIVQDLLTLARRGVTTTEIMNLNDVILDYLKSPEHLKLVAYYPDIHFETDLEIGLLNIRGSSVHLRKTIMNLVSNAAEAQPTGGKINISTRNRYIDIPIKGYEDIREGDFVLLEVKDNGFGISAEDLNRIFEPFYSKKALGRSGTGLGMAVVWGTVQDHHGYINVESVEGEGTTFYLYFPVSREKVRVESDLIPIDEYVGSGQTILVVDDVKEQRTIAENILRKLNYSVTSVASGEEAVAYLENNSVDLLVLDMIMDPGIDGLETYRRIIQRNPRQKAIIASGFSETDRVREAQRLGAGQYLKKPYTLEKIGMAIKEALQT